MIIFKMSLNASAFTTGFVTALPSIIWGTLQLLTCDIVQANLYKNLEFSLSLLMTLIPSYAAFLRESL